MTKTNMDLSELLAKQDGGDFLRSVAEAVLQLIMKADVEGLIGAGKHERAVSPRSISRCPSCGSAAISSVSWSHERLRRRLWWP